LRPPYNPIDSRAPQATLCQLSNCLLGGCQGSLMPYSSINKGKGAGAPR
jgi:hypothetical protein